MPAEDLSDEDTRPSSDPAPSQDLRPFLWPVIHSWALVLVPIAGWIVAQSLTSRIARNDEYTGALIHTLAASVFAVILGLSAVTNAIIVTLRFRDRPSSFRFRRFPLGLLILATVAVSWLICLVVGNIAQSVEFWMAIPLALASVYVFIQILQRDHASTGARRERLAARRDARSPASQRRVSVAKWLVPIGVVVVLLGIGTVSEIVPMVHVGCQIQEYGNFDGNYSMMTDCGSFAVQSDAASKRAASKAFYSSRLVTITTRGYAFGIPPLGIVTQITSTR
ncbi:hypothetical protein [Frigoribacterium sp. UYMn621]|uniref:hypothetical protein n=1 Tax=Frigoribacterium sp. UYMn621 TaxID=3156343 RepID=UPI003397AF99